MRRAVFLAASLLVGAAVAGERHDQLRRPDRAASPAAAPGPGPPAAPARRRSSAARCSSSGPTRWRARRSRPASCRSAWSPRSSAARSSSSCCGGACDEARHEPARVPRASLRLRRADGARRRRPGRRGRRDASGSSDRTAPASRRWCASWPASTRPAAGVVRLDGRPLRGLDAAPSERGASRSCRRIRASSSRTRCWRSC